MEQKLNEVLLSQAKLEHIQVKQLDQVIIELFCLKVGFMFDLIIVLFCSKAKQLIGSCNSSVKGIILHLSLPNDQSNQSSFKDILIFLVFVETLTNNKIMFNKKKKNTQFTYFWNYKLLFEINFQVITNKQKTYIILLIKSDIKFRQRTEGIQSSWARLCPWKDPDHRQCY